jgi:hypothetical protein
MPYTPFCLLAQLPVHLLVFRVIQAGCVFELVRCGVAGTPFYLVVCV